MYGPVPVPLYGSLWLFVSLFHSFYRRVQFVFIYLSYHISISDGGQFFLPAIQLHNDLKSSWKSFDRELLICRNHTFRATQKESERKFYQMTIVMGTTHNNIAHASYRIITVKNWHIFLSAVRQYFSLFAWSISTFFPSTIKIFINKSPFSIRCPPLHAFRLHTHRFRMCVCAVKIVSEIGQNKYARIHALLSLAVRILCCVSINLPHHPSLSVSLARHRLWYAPGWTANKFADYSWLGYVCERLQRRAGISKRNILEWLERRRVGKIIVICLFSLYVSSYAWCMNMRNTIFLRCASTEDTTTTAATAT